MVHWSSEISINQFGGHHTIQWWILKPCGRFWFLVSKIYYMLYFILWFFCPYTEFYPSCFFPHTDKHLAVLSQGTFDTQSIHIFGLVYYLSTARNSPFYIKCYTYGNQCSFCSKLMFTNGKNCKYMIRFYSNLYFCQTHIWTTVV